MNEVQMKTLLKTLKKEKHLFSVPEPDSGFEKRMIKSLRSTPEWKRESLWSKLNVFRFEVSVWRLAGAGICAVFVVVGSFKYFERTQNRFVNNENKRSHPELIAMIQRGGEQALSTWISVSGDLGAQSDAQMPKYAPSSDAEQKRILAELEKKWAPAL
ncbi:MAG: hypothetical protein R3A80_13915 [Bdellovibrionota bacterium]